MLDPLSQFNWGSLYSEYDKGCRRFDPNSEHIECLEEKPKSDRNLYEILINKIASDMKQLHTLSYCSYRSLVYWKLHSTCPKGAPVYNGFKRDNIKDLVESNLRSFNFPSTSVIKRNSSALISLILDLNTLDLPGIGTPNTFPMRSALLHFLYPEDVPIFDTMVLRAVGIDDKYANKKLRYLHEYIEHAWTLEDKYRPILNQLRDYTNLRLIDMALWVSRGTKHKLASADECVPHRQDNKPPIIKELNNNTKKATNKPHILTGLIRTLSQQTLDGWMRREIIIKQPSPASYPQVRDILPVIDEEGIRYTLPIIKGAHRAGYVCLGKPGDLKRWFLKHYSKREVMSDEVIFSLSDSDNAYRIYTSRQWEDRQASM